LRRLHTGFQDFAGADSVDRLIRIIHRLSWITPTGSAFSSGIIESMGTHARALSALKQALLSGASLVELNLHPLPPVGVGIGSSKVALNPQPELAGKTRHGSSEVELNPQPLPPR
jgi:hypothetical protein